MCEGRYCDVVSAFFTFDMPEYPTYSKQESIQLFAMAGIRNSYIETEAMNMRLRGYICQTGETAMYRIIFEATRDYKRPAIVLMVAPHFHNPRKGLAVLAEALDLAKINPHEKKLILLNWAVHVGINDIRRYLNVQKKEEKKAPEKTADLLLEQIYEEANKYLHLPVERRNIIAKSEEQPAEEKIPYVVDGTMLKLTPEELLAWK